MTDNEETPKSSSQKPYSGTSSIDVYAAQCKKCKKWRVIQSEEEFEEIRSELSEKPFLCDTKSGVSCDDPADIDYNGTRAWLKDKPDMPKTPEGFKRHLVVRKDYSKLDAYYITPEGKKVRSKKEIEAVLKGNPKYEELSASAFDFYRPKVMEKGTDMSNKKLKTSKDEEDE